MNRCPARTGQSSHNTSAAERLPEPAASCYPEPQRRPADEYLRRLIRAKRSFTPVTRHLLARAARRGDTQGVALVRDALRLLGVLVTYPVSRRPVRPLDTRLITRSRGTIDRLALGLMLRVFWHPLDFGMQRRQLLSLKRLVETA